MNLGVVGRWFVNCRSRGWG